MVVQAHTMANLERANMIRLGRAAVLRPLRSGEKRIGDIDLDAPELQSMLVIDLLASLRWRRLVAGPTPRASKAPARFKASRLLHDFGCGPRATIGQLSDARKAELVALVEASVPAQRKPR